MSDVFSCSGNLITLPTLMYLAESEAWTGSATIAPGGMVEFHDGYPVSARADRYDGLEALFELFIDRPHHVDFKPEAVSQTRPLGSTGSILYEAVRRADEWARLADVGLEARGTPPDTVPVAVRRVVARLDGRITLRQASAAMIVARNTLVQQVAQLMDAGIVAQTSWSVQTREVADEQANADPALAYFTAMESGRSAAREGRVEDAVAAFERALQIRPGDRVATRNLRKIKALA